MPQIDVPAETFVKLVERAAQLNVTLEAFVAPVLERAVEAEVLNGHETMLPEDLPYDKWKREFDAFLVAVKSRAGRYPPGFQADVSRESIYEGCGE